MRSGLPRKGRGFPSFPFLSLFLPSDEQSMAGLKRSQTCQGMVIRSSPVALQGRSNRVFSPPAFLGKTKTDSNGVFRQVDTRLKRKGNKISPPGPPLPADESRWPGTTLLSPPSGHRPGRVVTEIRTSLFLRLVPSPSPGFSALTLAEPDVNRAARKREARREASLVPGVQGSSPPSVICSWNGPKENLHRLTSKVPKDQNTTMSD